MTTPPLSQKNVTRILAVLVVALALLAGYYQSLANSTQRRLSILQKRHEAALKLIPASEAPPRESNGEAQTLTPENPPIE
jgi:hypothetical protein